MTFEESLKNPKMKIEIFQNLLASRIYIKSDFY